jgi:hypothetical protein
MMRLFVAGPIKMMARPPTRTCSAVQGVGLQSTSVMHRHCSSASRCASRIAANSPKTSTTAAIHQLGAAGRRRRMLAVNAVDHIRWAAFPRKPIPVLPPRKMHSLLGSESVSRDQRTKKASLCPLPEPSTRCAGGARYCGRKPASRSLTAGRGREGIVQLVEGGKVSKCMGVAVLGGWEHIGLSIYRTSCIFRRKYAVNRR